MFDSLTKVPKLTAIPVIHELYYVFQYGNRGSSFSLREGQLKEDENTLFLELINGLDPKKSERYLRSLNAVFDRITGFTETPKEKKFEAVVSPTQATVSETTAVVSTREYYS